MNVLSGLEKDAWHDQVKVLGEHLETDEELFYEMVMLIGQYQLRKRMSGGLVMTRMLPDPKDIQH